MKEKWKTIEGFGDKYRISSKGRVYNLKTQRERRPVLKRDGYLALVLHLDGKRYHRVIHRLVAEAFIPNLQCLPVVNHKNGIKTDNNVDKLEWCSIQQNSIHSCPNGLSHITRNKKVEVINEKTKERKCFISGREAARFYHTSGVSIGEWIKGIKPKRKDLQDLSFKYV